MGGGLGTGLGRINRMAVLPTEPFMEAILAIWSGIFEGKVTLPIGFILAKEQ